MDRWAHSFFTTRPLPACNTWRRKDFYLERATATDRMSTVRNAPPDRRITTSETLLWVSLVLPFTAGCTTDLWFSRDALAPLSQGVVAPHLGLAESETRYASAVHASSVGDPACVDHYYAAALSSWPRQMSVIGASDRNTELYRSSVEGFLTSAARYGRLHPTCGIQLTSGETVPIVFRGFPWRQQAFDAFVTFDGYSSRYLKRRYATAGVGAPLVWVRRASLPYERDQSPVAATALLRPGGNTGHGCPALEIYDPLRVGSVRDIGVPIARDLTAPIAYAMNQRGRSYLDSFLRPGATSDGDGLHMIEPFQPGKIPIVFVHGLLSDPLTWADLANELRASPDLLEKYQLWIFRYDTGEPFLSSAALLRRQLREIRNIYDAGRADPAFSRMVLVGHSMGGLVAKLQVTASGDSLWRSISRVPLDSINTDARTREELREAFYFRPSADVSRVIFIGTPHRGSSFASLSIGRIASSLVETPEDREQRAAQLRRDNPGAFSSELSSRIPTSIDLLRSDSGLLRAIDQLPFRYGVCLHSVVGDGVWSPLQGASDGVVAVDSARLRQPSTELLVATTHGRLHRADLTVSEIMRILRSHAGECHPGQLLGDTRAPVDAGLDGMF